MTRLRHLVLAPAFPLLLAACSPSPDAPDGPISELAVATAPAQLAGNGGAIERELGGAMLTVTDSGCALHPSESLTRGDRVRLHVEDPVVKQTIVDFGRIDDRHTFDDLRRRLRKVSRILETDRFELERRVPQELPSYFDSSLQGRSDISFPRGGMGPGRGTSSLSLKAGWGGTWFGPRGGAIAGTYAAICYRRRQTDWRVLGVAGPVQIGR